MAFYFLTQIPSNLPDVDSILNSPQKPQKPQVPKEKPKVQSGQGLPDVDSVLGTDPVTGGELPDVDKVLKDTEVDQAQRQNLGLTPSTNYVVTSLANLRNHNPIAAFKFTLGLYFAEEIEKDDPGIKAELSTQRVTEQLTMDQVLNVANWLGSPHSIQKRLKGVQDICKMLGTSPEQLESYLRSKQRSLIAGIPELKDYLELMGSGDVLSYDFIYRLQGDPKVIEALERNPELKKVFDDYLMGFVALTDYRSDLRQNFLTPEERQQVVAYVDLLRQANVGDLSWHRLTADSNKNIPGAKVLFRLVQRMVQDHIPRAQIWDLTGGERPAQSLSSDRYYQALKTYKEQAYRQGRMHTTQSALNEIADLPRSQRSVQEKYRAYAMAITRAQVQLSSVSDDRTVSPEILMQINQNYVAQKSNFVSTAKNLMNGRYDFTYKGEIHTAQEMVEVLDRLEERLTQAYPQWKSKGLPGLDTIPAEITDPQKIKEFEKIQMAIKFFLQYGLDPAQFQKEGSVLNRVQAGAEYVMSNLMIRSLPSSHNRIVAHAMNGAETFLDPTLNPSPYLQISEQAIFNSFLILQPPNFTGAIPELRVDQLSAAERSELARLMAGQEPDVRNFIEGFFKSDPSITESPESLKRLSYLKVKLIIFGLIKKYNEFRNANPVNLITLNSLVLFSDNIPAMLRILKEPNDINSYKANQAWSNNPIVKNLLQNVNSVDEAISKIQAWLNTPEGQAQKEQANFLLIILGTKNFDGREKAHELISLIEIWKAVGLNRGNFETEGSENRSPYLKWSAQNQLFGGFFSVSGGVLDRTNEIFEIEDMKVYGSRPTEDSAGDGFSATRLSPTRDASRVGDLVEQLGFPLTGAYWRDVAQNVMNKPITTQERIDDISKSMSTVVSMRLYMALGFRYVIPARVIADVIVGVAGRRTSLKDITEAQWDMIIQMMLFRHFPLFFYYDALRSLRNGDVTGFIVGIMIANMFTTEGGAASSMNRFLRLDKKIMDKLQKIPGIRNLAMADIIKGLKKAGMDVDSEGRILNWESALKNRVLDLPGIQDGSALHRALRGRYSDELTYKQLESQIKVRFRDYLKAIAFVPGAMQKVAEHLEKMAVPWEGKADAEAKDAKEKHEPLTRRLLLECRRYAATAAVWGTRGIKAYPKGTRWFAKQVGDIAQRISGRIDHALIHRFYRNYLMQNLLPRSEFMDAAILRWYQPEDSRVLDDARLNTAEGRQFAKLARAAGMPSRATPQMPIKGSVEIHPAGENEYFVKPGSMGALDFSVGLNDLVSKNDDLKQILGQQKIEKIQVLKQQEFEKYLQATGRRPGSSAFFVISGQEGGSNPHPVRTLVISESEYFQLMQSNSPASKSSLQNLIRAIPREIAEADTASQLSSWVQMDSENRVPEITDSQRRAARTNAENLRKEAEAINDARQKDISEISRRLLGTDVRSMSQAQRSELLKDEATRKKLAEEMGKRSLALRQRMSELNTILLTSNRSSQIWKNASEELKKCDRESIKNWSTALYFATGGVDLYDAQTMAELALVQGDRERSGGASELLNRNRINALPGSGKSYIFAVHLLVKLDSIRAGLYNGLQSPDGQSVNAKDAKVYYTTSFGDLVNQFDNDFEKLKPFLEAAGYRYAVLRDGQATHDEINRSREAELRNADIILSTTQTMSSAVRSGGYASDVFKPGYRAGDEIDQTDFYQFTINSIISAPKGNIQNPFLQKQITYQQYQTEWLPYLNVVDDVLKKHNGDIYEGGKFKVEVYNEIKAELVKAFKQRTGLQAQTVDGERIEAIMSAYQFVNDLNSIIRNPEHTSSFLHERHVVWNPIEKKLLIYNEGGRGQKTMVMGNQQGEAIACLLRFIQQGESGMVKESGMVEGGGRVANALNTVRNLPTDTRNLISRSWMGRRLGISAATREMSLLDVKIEIPSTMATIADISKAGFFKLLVQDGGGSGTMIENYEAMKTLAYLSPTEKSQINKVFQLYDIPTNLTEVEVRTNAQGIMEVLVDGKDVGSDPREAAKAIVKRLEEDIRGGRVNRAEKLKIKIEYVRNLDFVNDLNREVETRINERIRSGHLPAEAELAGSISLVYQRPTTFVKDNQTKMDLLSAESMEMALAGKSSLLTVTHPNEANDYFKYVSEKYRDKLIIFQPGSNLPSEIPEGKVLIVNLDTIVATNDERTVDRMMQLMKRGRVVLVNNLINRGNDPKTPGTTLEQTQKFQENYQKFLSVVGESLTSGASPQGKYFRLPTLGVFYGNLADQLAFEEQIRRRTGRNLDPGVSHNVISANERIFERYQKMVQAAAENPQAFRHRKAELEEAKKIVEMLDHVRSQGNLTFDESTRSSADRRSDSIVELLRIVRRDSTDSYIKRTQGTYAMNEIKDPVKDRIDDFANTYHHPNVLISRSVELTTDAMIERLGDVSRLNKTHLNQLKQEIVREFGYLESRVDLSGLEGLSPQEARFYLSKMLFNQRFSQADVAYQLSNATHVDLLKKIVSQERILFHEKEKELVKTELYRGMDGPTAQAWFKTQLDGLAQEFQERVRKRVVDAYYYTRSDVDTGRIKGPENQKAVRQGMAVKAVRSVGGSLTISPQLIQEYRNKVPFSGSKTEGSVSSHKTETVQSSQSRAQHSSEDFEKKASWNPVNLSEPPQKTRSIDEVEAQISEKKKPRTSQEVAERFHRRNPGNPRAGFIQFGSDKKPAKTEKQPEVETPQVQTNQPISEIPAASQNAGVSNESLAMGADIVKDAIAGWRKANRRIDLKALSESPAWQNWLNQTRQSVEAEIGRANSELNAEQKTAKVNQTLEMIEQQILFTAFCTDQQVSAMRQYQPEIMRWVGQEFKKIDESYAGKLRNASPSQLSTIQKEIEQKKAGVLETAGQRAETLLRVQNEIYADIAERVGWREFKNNFGKYSQEANAEFEKHFGRKPAEMNLERFNNHDFRTRARGVPHGVAATAHGTVTGLGIGAVMNLSKYLASEWTGRNDYTRMDILKDTAHQAYSFGVFSAESQLAGEVVGKSRGGIAVMVFDAKLAMRHSHGNEAQVAASQVLNIGAFEGITMLSNYGLRHTLNGLAEGSRLKKMMGGKLGSPQVIMVLAMLGAGLASEQAAKIPGMESLQKWINENNLGPVIRPASNLMVDAYLLKSMVNRRGMQATERALERTLVVSAEKMLAKEAVETGGKFAVKFIAKKAAVVIPVAGEIFIIADTARDILNAGFYVYDYATDQHGDVSFRSSMPLEALAHGQAAYLGNQVQAEQYGVQNVAMDLRRGNSKSFLTFQILKNLYRAGILSEAEILGQLNEGYRKEVEQANRHPQGSGVHLDPKAMEPFHRKFIATLQMTDEAKAFQIYQDLWPWQLFDVEGYLNDSFRKLINDGVRELDQTRKKQNVVLDEDFPQGSLRKYYLEWMAADSRHRSAQVVQKLMAKHPQIQGKQALAAALLQEDMQRLTPQFLANPAEALKNANLGGEYVLYQIYMRSLPGNEFNEFEPDRENLTAFFKFRAQAFVSGYPQAYFSAILPAAVDTKGEGSFSLLQHVPQSQRAAFTKYAVSRRNAETPQFRNAEAQFGRGMAGYLMGLPDSEEYKHMQENLTDVTVKTDDEAHPLLNREFFSEAKAFVEFKKCTGTPRGTFSANDIRRIDEMLKLMKDSEMQGNFIFSNWKESPDARKQEAYLMFEKLTQLREILQIQSDLKARGVRIPLTGRRPSTDRERALYRESVSLPAQYRYNPQKPYNVNFKMVRAYDLPGKPYRLSIRFGETEAAVKYFEADEPMQDILEKIQTWAQVIPRAVSNPGKVYQGEYMSTKTIKIDDSNVSDTNVINFTPTDWKYFTLENSNAEFKGMDADQGGQFMANRMLKGMKNSRVAAQQRLAAAQKAAEKPAGRQQLADLYSIMGYYSLGLHQGHARYEGIRATINRLDWASLPVVMGRSGTRWSAESDGYYDRARNNLLLPDFSAGGEISSVSSDKTLYWKNLMRQTFVRLFLEGKITFVNGRAHLSGSPRFSVFIPEGGRNWTIDFNNPAAAAALLKEGTDCLQMLNQSLVKMGKFRKPLPLTSANVKTMFNQGALNLATLRQVMPKIAGGR